MENTSERLRWRITPKSGEIALGNIITVIVLVVTAAIAYGSLTTRVASTEAQISGLTNAVKDTNVAIQNLAQILAVTQTLVAERTSRAEARQQTDTSDVRAEIRLSDARRRLDAASNRAAIQKNSAEIETKVTDKKHK